MAELLKSINPYTGQIAGEYRQAAPEKIEPLVQTVRQAQEKWREISAACRLQCFKKAKALLLDRKTRFAETITEEMGRPLAESMVLEISASLDVLDYSIRNTPDFLKPRRLPLNNLLFKFRFSQTIVEPLGVLGVITPWNWPLLIPLGCIVPALASGNGVIFKPSEYTPGVGQLIHELLIDAGIPESVFQLVQGGADVGQALVTSSIEKVFFTGSTEVGQKIMSQAAGELKPVVLELGGHDAAIVCEDACFENAVSGILWGAFCNAGQNCNSIERVYVHHSILNAFVNRLEKKIKQIRMGNPLNADVDMGPLALSKEVKKMEDLVRKAAQKGAEIRTGGMGKLQGTGQFFSPVLLLHHTAESVPEDEEYFGPVLSIIPFTEDCEAVRMANDSQFGLTASVWTENKNRADRLVRQLEAGTVMINDSVVSFGVPESHWTGVKMSGIGWVHGEKGFQEMVNIKYIQRNRLSKSQNFWWFPCSARMINEIHAGHEFIFRDGLIKKLSHAPGAFKAFFSYLMVNRFKADKL